MVDAKVARFDEGQSVPDIGGLNLVVFRNHRELERWSYRIGGEFAREAFDTEGAAKLAMFDAYWELSRDD
jgi:hypothetical protein